MTRSIWYVTYDGDTTITVIAETAVDAEQYAREHLCSDDSDGYEVVRAGDTLERRWVQYEDARTAVQDVRGLEQSGVDLSSVRVRRVSDGHDRTLYWEVGAYDADWCRCPDGVLCGGDE
jgi:hypothetical protein